MNIQEKNLAFTKNDVENIEIQSKIWAQTQKINSLFDKFANPNRIIKMKYPKVVSIMKKAIDGDENAKNVFLRWVAANKNYNMGLLNGIFDKKYGNSLFHENKNMNKIRLTEQDLHNIVKESVKRILNEIGNSDKGIRGLNAVKGRRAAKWYKENMSQSENDKNNEVISDAEEIEAKNKPKNMSAAHYRKVSDDGYNYGFYKGLQKYGKK